MNPSVASDAAAYRPPPARTGAVVAQTSAGTRWKVVRMLSGAVPRLRVVVDRQPGAVERQLDDCRPVCDERRSKRGFEVGVLLHSNAARATGPRDRGEVDRSELGRDADTR